MSVETVVVIPFRDRGIDPLRRQNLDRVLDHWWRHGYNPRVTDDGRTGDEQFNRSAAYNRAVKAAPNAKVFIFAESDVILPIEQVLAAEKLALEGKLGLIVPFTEYHYLTPANSAAVRAGREPEYADAQWIMTNSRSVGAVNVISREVYDRVGGYDENFEGSWYDDNAMRKAFEMTCSATAFCPGPVFHLYHKPGWAGQHLTAEDREATERNKARYARYEQASTAEEIRALTMEGR